MRGLGVSLSLLATELAQPWCVASICGIDANRGVVGYPYCGMSPYAQAPPGHFEALRGSFQCWRSATVAVGHFVVFEVMSFTWRIRPQKRIHVPLVADDRLFTSEGFSEVPEMFFIRQYDLA